jgi:hypothetical protein
MKYICEIDVAWDGDDRKNELYCGKECPWYDKNEKKSGGMTHFCHVFHKKLKLEIMPYELPAVLRCDECRGAFYPDPKEVA